MTSLSRAPDVPGYAVLGLLGTGGLGAVWKARSAAGAIVALKVVEPRRPVDSATADRIFRREALAGLNLDHPGIVRALDAVKARDGRPCIVFELAEGPTLRDAVKARGALPAEEVLGVARSAAAALDHAHRHGVVHGDLAPGNVLLAAGGARLLDFGLVAELEAEPGGSVWATPGFTAPEVVAGGAPTAASDLFALGRTLAFALLGRTPEGDGDLELPGERTGLVAVIERLGRRDPAGRYRSAAELGLDLDAVRAGEAPLGAALAGAKERMAARRTGPWVLAGVALAVVAGFLLLRDPPTVPVPPTSRLPDSAPAPAPDPLAGKVEALRVLLGRDPVDFGAARSLAAEIRKAGREDAVLAELDARWREAAAAIAAKKNAEAQAALMAGDRAAWRKVMLDWPAGFEDAAEAAAMQAQWERWDAATRKMAVQTERILAEGEKALAAGNVADPVALDADLARMQEDPATPPDLRRRAGELRAKAGAKAAEAARYAKEAEIRDAIRAFLESAAKPEPPARVQELLKEAIGKAEGTEMHAALEDLRNGAHRAETALARSLERLVGKPWAAVIDEKLFVGIVETAPSTEAVLLPLAGRCQYLLSIVPDRTDLSSWLTVHGLPSTAEVVGGKGSPVARVLPLFNVTGYARRKDSPNLFLWLTKPAGASPARPKENPAKGKAVEAYLADDFLGAWRAIEESFLADYEDAEVHVLAARVLIGLSRPLSTRRIRDIALAEALKAADLDPTLHSAHSAVIEIAMPLEQEEFRSSGDNTGLAYLTLVLRAMEASIPLGKESPEGFVALARKLQESGQVSGAKRAIEFAKRLKASLPPWAEDLLR